MINQSYTKQLSILQINNMFKPALFLNPKQKLMVQLMSSRGGLKQSLAKLKQFGVVEDVSLEQLLHHINGHGFAFAQLMSQQLIQDCKTESQNQNKPLNFVFPIVKGKQMYNHRFQHFIHNYVQQNQEYFESLKEKASQVILEKPKKKVMKQEGQDSFLKWELQLQKPSDCYPNEFQDNISPKPKSDLSAEKIQNNIGFQQLQTHNQNAERVYPSVFFSRDGKKQRPSTKSFLSIDVTDVFQAELNEVIGLIRQQINNEQSLFSTFYQYAYCYLQFYNLREGKCESNLQEHVLEMNKFFDYYQDSYLSDENYQINYCWPKCQSRLMQYWNKMQEKLEKHLQTTLPNKEILKHMLNDILDNVFLQFTPSCSKTERVYGESDSNGIFINIGGIGYCNQYIQDLRKETLKAYLFLKICRETANLLARKLANEQLGSSNRSITLDNRETIGWKILKLTKRKTVQIKKVFKKMRIRNQISTSNIIYKRRIQEQTYRIYKFITQNKQVINIFSQILPLLHKAQNLLKAANYVRDSIRNIHLYRQTLEKLWSEAQQYINLESPIKQHTCEQDIKKQIKYTFFFAFSHATSILDLLRSIENLKKDKFFKLHENRHLYYLPQKSCQIIQQFLKHITDYYPSFFESEHLQSFTELFLEKQDPMKFLNNLFQMIFQKFPKGMIQDCRYKLENFYNIKTDSLKLFKFYIHNRDLKFPRDMRALFKFKITYQIMMQFLKNSELFMIAAQVPAFFLLCQDQYLESGFDFERNLFPNINRQTRQIYAKDYEHMQNLDYEEAQKVGKSPKDPNERRRRIFVGGGQAKYVSNQSTQVIWSAGLVEYHDLHTFTAKFKWNPLNKVNQNDQFDL